MNRFFIFPTDAIELFHLTTKANKDTNKEVLEGNKPVTQAFEEINEKKVQAKAWDSFKGVGTIDTSLVQLNFIIRENNSQSWMNDDAQSKAFSNNSHDLSIKLLERNTRRKLELTNKREALNKGNFLVGVFVYDIFGSAAHQEKGIYGERFKFTKKEKKMILH